MTPSVIFQICSFYRGDKALFFVTFNIFIRHIFPENWIEIPQVVRRIWKFSSTILANFITFFFFFWTFWYFLVANKLMREHIANDVNIFYLQPIFNRLFNNCIKLYWYWISSFWNMSFFFQKKTISKKPSLIRG